MDKIRFKGINLIFSKERWICLTPLHDISQVGFDGDPEHGLNKNIKKIGEMPERKKHNLTSYFLCFQISHFSFHYAYAPLEGTMQSCFHTVCYAGSHLQLLLWELYRFSLSPVRSHSVSMSDCRKLHTHPWSRSVPAPHVIRSYLILPGDQEQSVHSCPVASGSCRGFLCHPVTSTEGNFWAAPQPYSVFCQILELERKLQDLQIQEKGLCRITNDNIPVCVSAPAASRSEWSDSPRKHKVSWRKVFSRPISSDWIR